MSKIEKAFITINEMISQRDYELVEENDEYIFCLYKNEGIVIFKDVTNKLNMAKITNFQADMEKLGYDHSIILYVDYEPTPNAKKIPELVSSLGKTIELFNIADLQYNITKHILVPKHERLSYEDAKEFKRQFLNDTAIILKTDPISKFYNFNKGDVIKITRRDGEISYRTVR